MSALLSVANNETKPLMVSVAFGLLDRGRRDHCGFGWLSYLRRTATITIMHATPSSQAPISTSQKSVISSLALSQRREARDTCLGFRVFGSSDKEGANGLYEVSLDTDGSRGLRELNTITS